MVYFVKGIDVSRSLSNCFYVFIIFNNFEICFSFRIIGFDDLGNTDDFPTEVLEKRLASSGLLDNSAL